MILGIGFVSAGSLELSRLESKRLLKGGYPHKQQFPKKLFILTNQAADLLSVEAEQNRITIECVPEGKLLKFIGEARDSYNQPVSGGRVQ